MNIVLLRLVYGRLLCCIGPFVPLAVWRHSDTNHQHQRPISTTAVTQINDDNLDALMASFEQYDLT